MAMSYNSAITIDRDRRALLSTAAIGIADRAAFAVLATAMIKTIRGSNPSHR